MGGDKSMIKVKRWHQSRPVLNYCEADRFAMSTRDGIQNISSDSVLNWSSGNNVEPHILATPPAIGSKPTEETLAGLVSYGLINSMKDTLRSYDPSWINKQKMSALVISISISVLEHAFAQDRISRCVEAAEILLEAGTDPKEPIGASGRCGWTHLLSGPQHVWELESTILKGASDPEKWKAVQAAKFQRWAVIQAYFQAIEVFARLSTPAIVLTGDVYVRASEGQPVESLTLHSTKRSITAWIEDLGQHFASDHHLTREQRERVTHLSQDARSHLLRKGFISWRSNEVVIPSSGNALKQFFANVKAKRSSMQGISLESPKNTNNQGLPATQIQFREEGISFIFARLVL
jgi:hypothetical protein